MLARVLIILAASPLVALAADPQRGWSITERPDGSRLVSGIWLRPSLTCDWADLVRFSIQEGQLVHDATTGDRLRAMLRGRRDVLVRVRPAPDLWRIEAARDAADGWTAKFAAVREKQPAVAAANAVNVAGAQWYRPTLMTVADDDEISFAGDGLNGQRQVTAFVASSARKSTVRMQVNSIDDRGQPVALTLEAGSMMQLIADHPVECRQYLFPLLRGFAGERFLAPGAADVYRAFFDIPADDPVAKTRATAALAQMADPAPSRRSAGEAALEALGARGILVLLRLEPPSIARLSPEQRQRVDNVLARQSLRGDPTQLARDPWFLFDCLSDGDVRVRTRAKEALAKLLAHEPDISADADPTTQRAARAKLADEIGALAASATR